ncbi:MAG: DUF362 domain-containing protein [Verrucomicrobia bacterium]|nr:DUF362 domain-containing protein [Verrucomicrobiota bacterium]
MKIFGSLARLARGAAALCLAAASFAADSGAPAKTPVTARVIIVQDPAALETYTPQPEKIRAMLERGLTLLTGKTNAAAAWRSLVSTQDCVGIKVFSEPGAISGTRPEVVAAVAEGLLAAGVPRQRIVIWDKSLDALQRAGFVQLAERLGVRVAASLASGYDEKTFYQPEHGLIGQLVWSDLEFGKKGDDVGRRSFVTKLLAGDVTKIINVTPLLNHNVAGVSGNLLGLSLASVDNTMRFESDPTHLAIAVPEIWALPAVGDRVVLNIVDALLCQYQGEQRGLLHYSVPLGQLRFSTDPVALDVLSIQELEQQRKAQDLPQPKLKLDLYRNASLLELGVSDPARIRVETVK